MILTRKQQIEFILNHIRYDSLQWIDDNMERILNEVAKTTIKDLYEYCKEYYDEE